ncbi:MAG: RAMP superfamily CRISPR-associated protein [candidate division WOR-3 bacterium]
MNSVGLKALYNQAMLDIVIKPDGPILIKAADNLDATKPDMQFTRLRTPAGDTVYLPGSSLKGVIRSCAERLLRTQGIATCDPLGGDRCRGESGKQKLHYSRHCYACRTFGSTDLASRVFFSDAFPWPVDAKPEERQKGITETEKYLQVRPGIGIDRKKGTVKTGAVFDLEVLTGGEFHTRIALRNYQLWQLGLLLYVFDDLNSGAQKLGFGKTRGLGKVTIGVTRLTVKQYGRLAENDKQLAGIGAVADLVETYDLIADDALTVETQGKPETLSLDFAFEDKALEAVLDSLKTSGSMKALVSLSKQGKDHGTS